MANITVWPGGLLRPGSVEPNPVPFSRTTPRALGGNGSSTRTDNGYWDIAMLGIALKNAETRRWWNAIRTMLGGRSGLAIIPVWSKDTAPYASGHYEPLILTTHSDGSPFSDGSMYSQNAIRITNVDDVAIGATSIRLTIETGYPFLSGVRFSYNHALYETGFHGDPVSGVYTCPIFPSVRAPIPAGSSLNFDNPTCLVHLKEDRGMDVAMSYNRIDLRDVMWEEAVDYWNALAVAG